MGVYIITPMNDTNFATYETVYQALIIVIFFVAISLAVL